MKETEKNRQNFLIIKIVQGGDTLKVVLDELNLKKKFKHFYQPLLKDLKLKDKEIFFSNDSGKMVSNLEFNLPLNSIIEKFGTKLNLYSEKIL